MSGSSVGRQNISHTKTLGCLVVRSVLAFQQFNKRPESQHIAFYNDDLPSSYGCICSTFVKKF